ncbi:hypothetical protein CKAH01_14802 [Colletotrichum kahawae]|uniref:Uncharacterized protein n=1 Tax=Colletotrichum kahawae TaxID=34407 RepID=A0AAD9YL71_COLKA|nr:hypothetical protein CKAH01_14802 [Colletotrichum kahawae]
MSYRAYPGNCANVFAPPTASILHINLMQDAPVGM